MSKSSSFKYLSWLGALLHFCGAIGALQPQPSAAQIVSIPSENLARAIRAALNRADNELITVPELESLTVLDASEETLSQSLCCPFIGGDIGTLIDSLEGLQFATNLVSLNLDADGWSLDGGPDPQLSQNVDFSTLAALTRLQRLNLANNNLSNADLASTLATLTKLQTLDLGGNLLRDASFLTSLTELRSLDLSQNPFTNWTAVGELKKLENLVMANCSLSGVSFLSGLTNLRSLDLSRNKIKNLLSLPTLPNLRSLRLDQNSLTNFFLPTGMSRLEELHWEFVNLSSISLPPDMTNLLTLSTMGELTDLEFLRPLNKLQTLEITAQSINGFPAVLDNLTNLSLSVYSGTATAVDFTFLSASPQLRSLQLYHYGVAKLQIPEGLLSLQTLSAGGGRLREVTLPADLHSLLSLSLSGQFSSITIPEGMTSLEFLALSGALTNVTWPVDLRKLSGLFLNNNQLRSLTLPEKLKDTLTLLYLTGNPLSDFAFLEGFHRLEKLFIPAYVKRITLPNGLTDLRELEVGDLNTQSYPGYLALPACIDLTWLNLRGFPKEIVTVLGFWIGAPSRSNDGQMWLRVSGATGNTIQVQNSTNLFDWKTWKTATLAGNRADFVIEPALTPVEFFRVLQLPAN